MLNGKVAIITGGTRGIGFAIVKKYLDNGATVVLCGSRRETAEKAVEKLKQENPEYKVEGIAPDLTSYEEIKEGFEYVKNKYGKIDILVNNAGISARESLYDYKPEDFTKIMDLNVNAVFNCSQVAATIMKEQHGGVILNTSSMVSIYGQPTGCGYPASKFAINGLTKSLARELGKDNIRVNAVAPGITNTDMVASLPEEIIKPLIATIPLGRVGEPEDVANAFLYLASDMASYVTGVILSVDGAARS
jgi:NAD(P)-dependent dehydrogenase (short-subunit alcohol dehydrogenase family)